MAADSPCYYCEMERTYCKVCIHGEADADELMALLSPKPGWKVVPIEPTWEMARLGADKTGLMDFSASAINVYRAMINAAPEPIKGD